MKWRSRCPACSGSILKLARTHCLLRDLNCFHSLLRGAVGCSGATGSLRSAHLSPTSSKALLGQCYLIGGYGRSGSTLFERLLTANPRWWLAARCAAFAATQKYGERHARAAGAWISARSGARSGNKLRKPQGMGPSSIDLAMLNHISQFFGHGGLFEDRVGLRSHAVSLAQELGGDFLLVHLVRDPRGVCWSTLRTMRRRKAGDPSLAVTFARSSAGCSQISLVRLLASYTQSDICAFVTRNIGAPQDVLAHLGKVALSPSSLDSVAKNDNRHQLHGNRMRLKLMSVTDLKQDVAWKAKMPAFSLAHPRSELAPHCALRIFQKFLRADLSGAGMRRAKSRRLSAHLCTKSATSLG